MTDWAKVIAGPLVEEWREPLWMTFTKRMRTAEECADELLAHLRESGVVEQILEEATMAEHKSHIEFENELYATLVDPLAEGPIKEAEMRKQLLESARWYRQRVYDLETDAAKAKLLGTKENLCEQNTTENVPASTQRGAPAEAPSK